MKKRLVVLLLAGMAAFTLSSSVWAEEEEIMEEYEENDDFEGDEYDEDDYANEDIDIEGLTAELEEMAAHPIEIKWEEISEKLKDHPDWAGEFQTIDLLGLKIYTPDQFKYEEADENLQEEGYIGFFETKKEAIGIQVIDLDDPDMTLFDYGMELCIDYGMDVYFTDLNGIPSLIYEPVEIDEEDEAEFLEDEYEEADEYEEYLDEEDQEEVSMSEDEIALDSMVTLVIPAEDGLMIEMTFVPMSTTSDLEVIQMMSTILCSIQLAD